MSQTPTIVLSVVLAAAAAAGVSLAMRPNVDRAPKDTELDLQREGANASAVGLPTQLEQMVARQEFRQSNLLVLDETVL